MNLPYELAKELKDAGYPIGVLEGFGGNQKWVPELKEWVTFPTLSELIEAVDDKEFFRLQCQDGRWFAASHKTGDASVSDGTAPEEAVAMLYLAIHGKARTPMEGR